MASTSRVFALPCDTRVTSGCLPPFSCASQGWSVDQRLSLALDAADAVAYLHSFDPPIIHHDIKVRWA